jgi:broad specificity phosphatase PhoE
MGKLILVRYGHTCLSVPGKDERLRIWLDIPLDDQGLAEAAIVVEKQDGVWQMRADDGKPAVIAQPLFEQAIAGRQVA